MLSRGEDAIGDAAPWTREARPAARIEKGRVMEYQPGMERPRNQQGEGAGSTVPIHVSCCARHEKMGRQ
jgi:hypothetical protein